MKRIERLIVAFLALAPAAYAQSDTELMAKAHARIEKIYLGQASFTLPQSFYSNGLDPKARTNLIAQWAEASATCQMEALHAYSLEHKIPLKELIADDGSYTNELHVDANWEYRLKACLDLAWEAVGATPYPD